MGLLSKINDTAELRTTAYGESEKLESLEPGQALFQSGVDYSGRLTVEYFEPKTEFLIIKKSAGTCFSGRGRPRTSVPVRRYYCRLERRLETGLCVRVLGVQGKDDR